VPDADDRPRPTSLRDIQAQHPRFFHALFSDARLTAAHRGERFEFRSKGDALLQSLRLAWMSDAFFAQALYRAKARLQALGVPVLPRLAHRLAMMSAQVCIGDPVIVRPGLYLAHGQVVIDGVTELDSGVVIFPWVTIGLRSGDFSGPKIGPNVKIGSGAKVVGPVKVGAGARIGANAVVIADVPSHATVVGVPGRVVGGVDA
jgi:serine O-acetyltransferase